jgi:hypothetical protein
MQNVLSADYRKAMLDEILGEENRSRKAESFRRSEIYNKRQAPYVEQALKDEGFSEESVSDMRKITSINIAPRVVDKLAPLYQEAPDRTFNVESGDPLSEDSQYLIEEHYDAACINTKLLRANRIKKFQNQAIAQVVPVKSKGIIDLRIYQPHQVDCIPMESDPEIPYCFIVSSFDRSLALSGGDKTDQTISDRNDGEGKARAAMRFVWWTDENNFITDGNGMIIGDAGDVENPIGVMPFVDISDEKENEFWVRKGSSVIDFAIDFAVVLSDTANINRLQGYAQPIISSAEKPKTMHFGPNEAIWLQLDPNATVQPSFAFANPSPDMAAALDLQDRLVNYFLSSEGLDTGVVSSKGELKTYSSGFERMLAMIEQFGPAKQDIDIFETVEQKIYDLFVKWINHYAGTTVNNPLMIQGPAIPEGGEVHVNYKRPEAVQSKTEVQTSEINMLNAGLRSKAQALANIDGITTEEAMKRLSDAQPIDIQSPDQSGGNV